MVKKIFTFNIVDRYKLKSGDDVEMKRTIFNNLVFCTNIEDPKTSNIILMNLRTFRRELISYAEYIELCDFENGKTKEVPNIYNRLRVKKQILSETEKASFDEQVYKKSCEDKIVRQQNDGVLITDIAIFPTYSCNFKCKYCYESSFLQSAFLTERDIDKICKFIQEINQTDGSTSEEFAKRTKDGTYEKFFKTGSRLLRRDMAKIAISRIFYAQKKIRIYDEPTASLDEESAKAVIHSIINNRKGINIVITHDMRFVKLFNRVIEL